MWTSHNKYHRQWISDIAPGTPAIAEGMFLLIRKGQSDSKRFKIAKQHYKHLSDKQIWQAYEAWTEGAVDPCLLEKPEEEKDPFK